MLTPNHIRKGGADDYYSGIDFFNSPDVYNDVLTNYWKQGWLAAHGEVLRKQLEENERLLAVEIDQRKKICEANGWEFENEN